MPRTACKWDQLFDTQASTKGPGIPETVFINSFYESMHKIFYDFYPFKVEGQKNDHCGWMQQQSWCIALNSFWFYLFIP